MKTILIIEDDPAIQQGLTEVLTEEHFKVLSATDGEIGYQMARRECVSLIILDLMLPGKNGRDICRDLRRDGVKTPILMLTSKKQEADKVLGLELGADDYVTKPFGVKELVARVRALLRRETLLPSAIVETRIDNLSIDFEKQEARRGKRSVSMSAREFQLLRYFVEREGNVITRAMLLDDVWGYDVTPTTRTVDNYILSLRKKIEHNPAKPSHLLTVHTAGYKFVK
ncbi:MAG TPA: response regulator transcription factor [Bacteroidota bacterium]|nr:response regulator transcription factor [Bacteroidota bacterium]